MIRRCLWVPLVLLSTLLAGMTLFLVGLLFHFAVPFLVPAMTTVYDDHPELFRSWSGWTQIYMLFHPFVYGIVFASGFHVLRVIMRAGVCDGKRMGFLYGLLVFAIGSLPVFLLEYSSLKVPGIVIISWILQSLFQYTLAGTVLGWFADRQAQKAVDLARQSVLIRSNPSVVEGNSL